MAEGGKWAVGSGPYKKRPGTRPMASAAAPAQQPHGDQLSNCSIWWDAANIDFGRIPGSTVERSRHRFRESLPNLIWNAAALEGNTFTLPEVKTLLDGVTVGGRPQREASQILALSEGYSFVDDLVGAEKFLLSKEISDAVHGRVAVHEAIESGHFRGEGPTGGGGTVQLAGGGYVEGFEAGESGSLLIDRYRRTIEYLEEISDPRERALVYFASATRQQFYFDGNKRTARLMMSGELMTHGFEVVSVPFARKFEFNLALDTLFTTSDATPLLSFLVTCTQPG